MTNNNYPKNNLLILIVDDDASIRMTAAGILENQGYSILEADSGEACLSICRVQKPDIILLDAVMPGMDGFTCCLKINDTFGIQCPPILMMTALDDRDSVYRSFDVGITDYFVKPLNWISLPEKVAKLALARAYNNTLKRQFEELKCLKEQLSDCFDNSLSKEQKTESIEFNFA
ncbi:MAG: response regulator [Xenococcaceae cyanobacterium MO_207.B15]|nr:response regulator [Xenococcaceae cyanobacterium MO_207.B15]